MDSAGGYAESDLEAAGRRFAVRIVRFENGTFVAVHEGAPRIGAMTVSVSAQQPPVTTQVIPARSDAAFIRMLAEMVGSRRRGVTAVSVHADSEIGPAASRELGRRIMEML